MKLEKILKNKYVYYVAVFLMVLNVLGYVANGSMECVIIFALSTYLSNQFLTKNPTLDILVGLLVSNALFGCKSAVKEGMTDSLEEATKKAHTEAVTKAKVQDKKGACLPGKAGADCREKAKKAKQAASHLTAALGHAKAAK